MESRYEKMILADTLKTVANYFMDQFGMKIFSIEGNYSTELQKKDFVRKELARVRATTMEGSFGPQKEHYDLKRVKARKN